MTCAWQSLLEILPLGMRSSVDRLGNNDLLELRMRVNRPLMLKMLNKTLILERRVTRDDMHFTINAASRYSPWLAETAAFGYITADGGHRIGLCGNAVGSTGSITDISGITSLCIRIARDFYGIARTISDYPGSVLILGKPGSGKTTLLRDLIRLRSLKGECICVVDDRRELFPRVANEFCFESGPNTDIISGCNKTRGIEAVLRAMAPDTIAVDEITQKEDCVSILKAAWCGVNILATIHAETKNDLLNKPLYRLLVENNLFDNLVYLGNDKTFTVERLRVCH